MGKVRLTGKIWFLMIVVLLSFLSIFVTFDPLGISFLSEGVVIQSVDENSKIYEDGLRPGATIKEINGKSIASIEEYQEEISVYSRLEENMTSKLVILTDTNEIIGLYNSSVSEDIRVKKLEKTKLSTGLDLPKG